METIQMTLTKTVDYNLKPFGKFVFKFTVKGKDKNSPNVIPVYEVDIKHDTAMLMNDVEENIVRKHMIKYQTDVLTDGRKYYTITNSGLTEIYHKKIGMYKYDEAFKIAVDNNHSFGKRK